MFRLHDLHLVLSALHRHGHCLVHLCEFLKVSSLKVEKLDLRILHFESCYIVCDNVYTSFSLEDGLETRSPLIAVMYHRPTLLLEGVMLILPRRRRRSLWVSPSLALSLQCLSM